MILGRRPHRLLAVVLRRSPDWLRRIVAAGLGAVLADLARRRRRSTVLPQLAFVAWTAASRTLAAEHLARRFGTSETSPAVTRRELTELAAGAGMTDVADAIALSNPSERAPAYDVLRARAELRAGRYSDTLDHARRATAAGIPGMAGLTDLVEGRLAVLRPDWRPDLVDETPRLTALHGTGVPGRVMHLVSASLPYRTVGYTVRTQSVARSQAEVGLEPHVVTRAGFPGNEGPAGAPSDQSIDGIPYHHLLPDLRTGRPDRGLTAGAKAAVAVLEAIRPAVIQPASNHLMAQSALALARPMGIPVVYEVRGFWEDSWAAEQGLGESEATETDRYVMTVAAETAAMQEADAVVTLSEAMRQEIIGRGCDPAKVVVVPNAVEAERFAPARRDDALGRRLGIESGDPVVGYVTSLTAYEGIGVLLDAVASLRPRFPSIRALIVGDGPERTSIEERARELGLDRGTLVMPGRIPHDEIARYYSLIDVFVVPRIASRVTELVSPLKPFEAMALARPIVVADLRALREIVTPGETGLIYPPGDAAALAESIRSLLDDPDVRARLGANAREWVLANRTWSANGRRYRELFERLGAA
jgi:glycosyltransferase involved in cell wall biosynthesis